MNAEISAQPRRRRVPAMAPDERRAALIAATVPLLRQYGPAVSTGQIADAAGVAEGTIFGVFPDKTSLIRSAILTALDPAPVIEVLGQLDPTLPLRARLEAVATLLVRRMADNANLIAASRGSVFAGDGPGPPAELLRSRQDLIAAVAAVIEPDRALLRGTPTTTARLLMSMSFASGSGVFGVADSLTGQDIVSLLLDGLLIREGTGESPC